MPLVAPKDPVSQEGHSDNLVEHFTLTERTLVSGFLTVGRSPVEAPLSDRALDGLGIRIVSIHAMRRTEGGVVEFGIGNEAPPILAWVTRDKFSDWWPD